MTYFVVVRSHGTAWDTTLPVRQERGGRRGFVVLGGPVGDDETILLVVKANHDDVVVRQLTQDPWSAASLWRSSASHRGNPARQLSNDRLRIAERDLCVACHDRERGCANEAVEPQHPLSLDAPSRRPSERSVGTAGAVYVVGDFLAHPFNAESFDFIASVAMLHHMDGTVALTRMRAILRPGGSLAVLGLARSDSLRDLPYEAAGVLAHRVHSLTREHWEHPSPKVWPPPETYTGMRRLADDLLPGARFRRHALWRYSIVWSKPASVG